LVAIAVQGDAVSTGDGDAAAAPRAQLQRPGFTAALNQVDVGQARLTAAHREAAELGSGLEGDLQAWGWLHGGD